MKTHILILGGGFAGVKCALELQQQHNDKLHIRLISQQDNFEYHGSLYRLVSGRSPLEVCLPLRNILDEKKVDIINDTVVSIDKKNQSVEGASGSSYRYDIVVVALGAVTDYHGMPELEEQVWGMKTANDALKLRQHIHQQVARYSPHELEEQHRTLRFVVVGAGTTGVEMAGELACVLKKLARQYDIDYTCMSVELVEQADRVLPSLQPALAQKITKRLDKLGVRVHTGRAIQSLSDSLLAGENHGSSPTPTVIWTAGTRTSGVVDTLRVKQREDGRVVVNENMQVDGWDNMYFAGDVATTPFSGMAQTALHDGRYIANAISLSMEDGERLLPDYHPGEPIYAVPVGPRWAGAQWGQVRLYGYLGWLFRRLVDWKVFRHFLPLRQAFAAFRAYHHVQGEEESVG